mmetsp:Transcript_131774/g.409635  ORF Transcript_131774/g.409635 Transcript_131774/m.409635 type:complete len:212 (+) Transcript_131774:2231-2866(+)
MAVDHGGVVVVSVQLLAHAQRLHSLSYGVAVDKDVHVRGDPARQLPVRLDAGEDNAGAPATGLPTVGRLRRGLDEELDGVVGHAHRVVGRDRRGDRAQHQRQRPRTVVHAPIYLRGRRHHARNVELEVEKSAAGEEPDVGPRVGGGRRGPGDLPREGRVVDVRVVRRVGRGGRCAGAEEESREQRRRAGAERRHGGRKEGKRSSTPAGLRP